jgi:hypothetical protein
MGNSSSNPTTKTLDDGIDINIGFVSENSGYRIGLRPGQSAKDMWKVTLRKATMESSEYTYELQKSDDLDDLLRCYKDKLHFNTNEIFAVLIKPEMQNEEIRTIYTEIVLKGWFQELEEKIKLYDPPAIVVSITFPAVPNYKINQQRLDFFLNVVESLEQNDRLLQIVFTVNESIELAPPSLLEILEKIFVAKYPKALSLQKYAYSKYIVTFVPIAKKIAQQKKDYNAFVKASNAIELDDDDPTFLHFKNKKKE